MSNVKINIALQIKKSSFFTPLTILKCFLWGELSELRCENKKISKKGNNLSQTTCKLIILAYIKQ